KVCIRLERVGGQTGLGQKVCIPLERLGGQTGLGREVAISLGEWEVGPGLVESAASPLERVGESQHSPWSEWEVGLDMARNSASPLERVGDQIGLGREVAISLERVGGWTGLGQKVRIPLEYDINLMSRVASGAYATDVAGALKGRLASAYVWDALVPAADLAEIARGQDTYYYKADNAILLLYFSIEEGEGSYLLDSVHYDNPSWNGLLIGGPVWTKENPLTPGWHPIQPLPPPPPPPPPSPRPPLPLPPSW
ncbi:hypothetical protein CYMTET_29272, partial [Cymbomonas tetramitiformis]